MKTKGSEKFLGKIVVGRTALGEVQFVGQCVSFTDAPTVTVNLPDGSQAHWHAELCEVIELNPALEWLVKFFERWIPTKRGNEIETEA